LNYLATGDLSGETYPNSIVHIEIPCKVDTEIRENEYYIILLNMPDIGLAFIEKKPANYLFDFNFKCKNTKDYETGELLAFEFFIGGTFTAIIYDKYKYLNYINNRCIEMMESINEIDINRCHSAKYEIVGVKDCCAGSNRIFKLCNECCNKNNNPNGINDILNNINKLIVNFDGEYYDGMFGFDEEICADRRRIWNLKRSSGLKLNNKIFTRINNIIDELSISSNSSDCCNILNNIKNEIKNKKIKGECLYGDYETYPTSCNSFSTLYEYILKKNLHYDECDGFLCNLKSLLGGGSVIDACNFLYSNLMVLSVAASVGSDGKIIIVAAYSKLVLEDFKRKLLVLKLLLLRTEKFFDNCGELNSLEGSELNLKIETGYISSLGIIDVDLKDKFIKIKFLRDKNLGDKDDRICNFKDSIENIHLSCEAYYLPISYDPKVLGFCTYCGGKCVPKIYPDPPEPNRINVVYFPNLKISPHPCAFSCQNLPAYKSFFVVFNNFPSVVETNIRLGEYITFNGRFWFSINNKIYGLDAINNHPIKVEYQRYQLYRALWRRGGESEFLPVGELDVSLVSEDYFNLNTGESRKLATKNINGKLVVGLNFLTNNTVLFYIIDKDTKYLSIPFHYDKDLEFYGDFVLGPHFDDADSGIINTIVESDGNYPCEFSYVKFRRPNIKMLVRSNAFAQTYVDEDCSLGSFIITSIKSPCNITGKECDFLSVNNGFILARGLLYLTNIEATVYPGERFKVCEN
ncbi:MAG: hypothetical protein QXS18_06575, partial [Thermoplasmata archaeon]